MMFLHTLRLAGDLSFYYAFAGFFAASFGGTPMPLVLVWSALCFGLASCFEGSRPLRTTLAALSAAALLFLPTGADKLCYFPAAVYPVLLAYTGDFALSPMRQAERLRWLCRVWPFFAVAMLLWNANAVLSAALPFATAAAVLLVGFNRTTRQDPEISTRPGYLLLSGGVLAAVSGFLMVSFDGYTIYTQGNSLSTFPISCCVIGGIKMAGGKGTVVHMLLGVLIMRAISTMMSVMFLSTDMVNLITGILLVAVLIIDRLTSTKSADE